MKNLLLALGLLGIPTWASRQLPITVRISNVGGPTSGAINLAETRDASGKVTNVIHLAYAGFEIPPVATGSTLTLWWVCREKFDSLGIAAFNPDPSGNPPRIDLPSYVEAIRIHGYIPPSDTTIADESTETGETWEYRLVWQDTLHRTRIVPTYGAPAYGPASVEGSSHPSSTTFRLSGSVVELDMAETGSTRVDLLSPSGRILASRVATRSGRSDVEMGRIPTAGDMLVVRTATGAVRTQVVLPSR